MNYILKKLDGVYGLVFLAPASIIFSISAGKLSRSVDDLSKFISTTSDPKTVLTQNLDCMVGYLDELIIASYNFSQAIDEQTDKEGYLNFFNFSRVPKTLNELTAAHNGLSSCIQEKIDGTPVGSSEKSLGDFTKKIRETSDAQATFALVADPVHGITGLVAGTAALLFEIAANYAKLSRSLFNLSGAISNLSESSFTDLISAVNELARTEDTVSVAFYRLSELTWRIISSADQIKMIKMFYFDKVFGVDFISVVYTFRGLIGKKKKNRFFYDFHDVM